MEGAHLLWLLLAVGAWWLGAAAAGVRRELLELEDTSTSSDYGFVSLLQRLKDDPLHLGLRLRWSRFAAAALVPLALVLCLGPVSLRLGILAGLLGWAAAASADASGGGPLLRRLCRARSGAGYAIWARLTQPMARLARPLLRLRAQNGSGSAEPHNLFVEHQAALTPAGGRLGFEERRFLRKLLASTTLRVESIMTPWGRVRGLGADLEAREAGALLKASGHSRQPVLENGRVLGMVTAKDLLLACRENPEELVRTLARPAHYVRTDAMASEVLEEFQVRRVHLGIVVDALGRYVGLVTMEDLLEEIVGELYDERERHGSPAP